jgi:hypothetical protein
MHPPRLWIDGGFEIMFDQMKPLFSSQITSFQRESMFSPKQSKAKLASLFGRVQVQVDPLALPAPPLHLPNLTVCGAHMSASATGRGKGASTFPARDFPSPPPPARAAPIFSREGRKKNSPISLPPPLDSLRKSTSNSSTTSTTDPAAQPPSRSDKVSSSAPSLPRAQIPPCSTPGAAPASGSPSPPPAFLPGNRRPDPFLSLRVIRSDLPGSPREFGSLYAEFGSCGADCPRS